MTRRQQAPVEDEADVREDARSAPPPAPAPVERWRSLAAGMGNRAFRTLVARQAGGRLLARDDWTEEKIAEEREDATEQAALTAGERSRRRKTKLSKAKADMEARLVKVFPEHRADPEKAVEAWFAGHAPDATFMGVPIEASSGSEAPGVHQSLQKQLQAAEALLVAKGMPKAGEEAPEGADPELAGFKIRNISGLRPPTPATDKATGVSMHCYGLAVDINVSANPYVRSSGARMVERATLLINGTKYTLDSKGGHGNPETAWTKLQAGSKALKAYFALGARGKAAIEAKLEAHPAAASQGDAAWWEEQIRLDREDEDRNKNWVHGSPTKGFMDLPKAFVKILTGPGVELRWGGTLSGGKDIMHFDYKPGLTPGP